MMEVKVKDWHTLAASSLLRKHPAGSQIAHAQIRAAGGDLKLNFPRQRISTYAQHAMSTRASKLHTTFLRSSLLRSTFFRRILCINGSSF
jgi:hypothetical protein